MEEHLSNMNPRHNLSPVAWCLIALTSAAFTGCTSIDSMMSRAQPAQAQGKASLANSPETALQRHPPAAGRPALSTTTSLQSVEPSPAEAYLQKTTLLSMDEVLSEGHEAVGIPTDPLRPDTTINLDDIEANKDLWTRMRHGFSLPMLESTLVADHERWYASRPDYVQRMTERSSRYLFHVLEEIERRQMPSELALLPFIESAFNPQAQSSARASGIWQFMPATGKDFALKQNLFRDDRRDVLASTRAALDYLQRLNRQFGDWHLALAAYNWGEGNVQKAINRNIKAGLPTDYLSLNMPAETRHYVPKLHAVRNIVERPQSFGLTLQPIENHPFFVSVPIQRDIDVALAAKLAAMSMDDFKALNPSMNKPVILAAGTPQVLLPYDNASKFVHNLPKHKGLLATWTAWRVPRTMRPGEAARQVGMNEAGLRAINLIPPKMLVKVGSTLLVPRHQHREQDVSESVADNAMMALAPDLPPMRRLTLRAGKRDSVASLALRYRVSASQVAQWNRVSASARFSRGQKVVVFVPLKKAATRTMARNNRTTTKASIKVASASRSSVRNNKGRLSAPVRSSKLRVASAR